jgi:hypothetical protein
MVGIPIHTSTWPSLLVNIEAAIRAAEGKRGCCFEPGQPQMFVFSAKTLCQLTSGKQLIAGVFLGPDKDVTR